MKNQRRKLHRRKRRRLLNPKKQLPRKKRKNKTPKRKKMMFLKKKHQNILLQHFLRLQSQSTNGRGNIPTMRLTWLLNGFGNIIIPKTFLFGVSTTRSDSNPIRFSLGRSEVHTDFCVCIVS